MPDYDLFPAVFADCNIATSSASIVAPIVTQTVAPIVIVATFALAVSVVAAAGSDTEVQLSECDGRFGSNTRTSILGGCWKNPHCARDGSDKRQFSHSNFLLCRNYE
jgi:hypothetical protein